MIFAVLLIAFVSVSAGSVMGAEAPEEEWNRTLGGSSNDYGASVQQTTDGGYIIAGSTHSFATSSYDVWLIKTAANGSANWTRTFGGSANDYGSSVRQTADGGYIVVGSTPSFGAGAADVWLIKTAANGSTDWTRTFGGSANDYGYSVQQTTDDGYIVAGSTASFGAGGYDVWLIKTAANGSAEWTRTFGGSSNDYGYSVQQTADDGYIVAGSTNSFGAGSGDVWLLKVAANGTANWTRTFGGSANDCGYSVQQTADGGYIVAGSTNSFGAGSGDVWLLKTAATGTAEWNSTFGGFSDDVGHAVQQTADGGYIIAGFTHSFGAGSGDVWLIKVKGVPAEPPIFDTGPGTYPSNSGTFAGTIQPSRDLTVSTLYTYPCSGTGGHTEYVTIWNSGDWNVTATWGGYTGDWHNITFNEPFILYANETYNYTIVTGSYPQIIHASSYNATGGVITCDEFVDANGKRHDGWIPAILLQ